MATRNRRSRRALQAIAGFTLLEILVVLIIIGVLVAIGAPSWSAFMTRQRIGVARDQISQVIRQTQAEARRTKLARVVIFDTSTTTPPRFASQRQPLDPVTERTAGLITPASIQQWQEIGNGEINAGQLEISTVPATAQNQIVFDANGAVDQVSAAGGTVGGRAYIFAVNVRQKGGSAGANRCVIVETLLGATRFADGTDCPTS